MRDKVDFIFRRRAHPLRTLDSFTLADHRRRRCNGENTYSRESMTMAFRVAFTVAVIVAIAGSRGQGSEVKIKAEELPKKVTDALNARFPGLTIVSAAKETDA